MFLCIHGISFTVSLFTSNNKMFKRSYFELIRGCHMKTKQKSAFKFLIFGIAVSRHRSGRRIRKTRKYDIITTPAERVEMAPLNEENEDEDDSTLFDVKYRFEALKMTPAHVATNRFDFHFCPVQLLFHRPP